MINPLKPCSKVSKQPRLPTHSDTHPRFVKRYGVKILLILILKWNVNPKYILYLHKQIMHGSFGMVEYNGLTKLNLKWYESTQTKKK
jgi:hypothetical protein